MFTENLGNLANCKHLARSRIRAKFKFESRATGVVGRLMAATSCERDRTSPYAEDLRWRMVWQREGLGLTLQQISNNLNVDKSTVQRVTSSFKESGTVSKKAYPRGDHVKPNKKLSSSVKLYIMHYVLQKPSSYLWELQMELRTSLHLEISLTSLSRFLKENNFTRQKLSLIARQRNESLRQEYISDVSIFESHMFVFIDETGTDRRDAIRKYGYSLQGKTPKSNRLLCRGERLSALAIMSCSGLMDVHIEHGTINGDKFLVFVERNLLPTLMPYDGVNPNSIVILDNASIHHVDGVVEMIGEVGALVYFLPPYSPDFAPIEECFSKVKNTMRAMEQEAQVTDIETIALAAFTAITPEDCKNWIGISGIY